MDSAWDGYEYIQELKANLTLVRTESKQWSLHHNTQ